MIERDCGKVVVKDSEGRFRCWVHESGKPVVVSDQFCVIKGVSSLESGDAIFCWPGEGGVAIFEEQEI